MAIVGNHMKRVVSLKQIRLEKRHLLYYQPTPFHKR